jgi:hypothetical protein
MKHAVQAVKHAAQAAGSAPHPIRVPSTSTPKCELEIINNRNGNNLSLMLAY